MQTFLPVTDMYWSVHTLDIKRLVKQIVEAYQIYSGRVPNPNHPACLMWKGNEAFLRKYIAACCGEYKLRFGKTHRVGLLLQDVPIEDAPKPSWYGNFVFHHAHRVNLLRKNRSHYLTFFLDMPPFGDEPEGYYWPVAKRGGKAWADSQRWLEWGRRHELI